LNIFTSSFVQPYQHEFDYFEATSTKNRFKSWLDYTWHF